MTADDLVTWAAIAAAVIYLFRLLRAAVLKLDRLDKLASKELEHNHGSSMKDDVHGLAVAFGHMQREVGALRHDFDTHVNERKTR